MNSPNYNNEKGTVVGEIRNAVYSKFGEELYNTAMYGWHVEHLNNVSYKEYTLVNTFPVTQFLITEVVLNSLTLPQVRQDEIIPPATVPLYDSPKTITFTWNRANVPFDWKYNLDKEGITYKL